ncbi:hypothetical protein B0H10DRAFT_651224 [Mycena sp. CBHHK59/15]|nr:hypothetical protein B0H10DRAFT_651224 [Mycena sp. CBHHK59/15]
MAWGVSDASLAPIGASFIPLLCPSQKRPWRAGRTRPSLPFLMKRAGYGAAARATARICCASRILSIPSNINLSTFPCLPAFFFPSSLPTERFHICLLPPSSSLLFLRCTLHLILPSSRTPAPTPLATPINHHNTPYPGTPTTHPRHRRALRALRPRAHRPPRVRLRRGGRRRGVSYFLFAFFSIFDRSRLLLVFYILPLLLYSPLIYFWGSFSLR